MRPALFGAALLPLTVATYAVSHPRDSQPLDALHAGTPRPQRPLAPGPVMPQEPQKPSNSGPPPTGDGGSGSKPNPVLLSDVMGRDRSINIFAGMVRDVETATSRLDDVARQSTVLAPRNSAVEALPRKPWEDPDDYGRLGANAYEGDDGRERAARNIRRFVEAHIVTSHPWKEGEKVKTMSGEGGEVWWETREGGGKVIQPGDIEVDSVSSSVENGEVVSQASGLRSPYHFDTKC